MRTIVIVLVALVCCALSGAAQLPSDSSLKTASQSVVRVDARECQLGSTSATGFVWRDQSHVVTALHAVAGCARVSVFYERHGAARAATITRSLRRADLALLEVSDPLEARPLAAAPQPLALHQQAVALGYYLNVPSVASTTLTLRFGGKVLRDIVPPDVATALQHVGSPAVDLEILNFEGHLLPGVSGAPILNAAGLVEGIADGGLETGLAGSSWGVPVRYLAELMDSSDSQPQAPKRLQELFAVDTESVAGERIRCGSEDLVKVRTRPFLELAKSTDDPRGLIQLSAVLGFQQADFVFDIYQHLASGATVAVPAGASVVSVPGQCVVRQAGGRMEMKITLKTVGSATEAQQVSLQYETDIAPAEGGAAWQQDLSWTYLAPVSRFDGLVVRRKAAGRFGPSPVGWISQKYLFETLAVRGPIFVGASVTNHDITPAMIQAEMACAGSAPPQCASLIEARRVWAQMVLAVHMTTFPIG